MPGLLFAHSYALPTVETFVRFASQIVFCYLENVIHFLTIALHLYNQHYDFKFTVYSIKFTVYSFKFTVYSMDLLVHSATFLGTKKLERL